MKKHNLNDLADAFISTDTAAIRDDVSRLGSVRAAAAYCSAMAAGQPDYAALDSDAGRKALRVAINALVEG